MRIVPIKAREISIIVRLEKQLYTQPWSQKDFEDLLNQEAFWFWVAKEGEEIVGYLVCQVVGEEAELHNIAVAKNYQRQGIAKRLIQKLLDELQRKKVSELYLMVRVSNRPAKKLYEHFGLKQTGIRKNYYHSPEEDASVFYLSMPKSPILSSS